MLSPIMICSRILLLCSLLLIITVHIVAVMKMSSFSVIFRSFSCNNKFSPNAAMNINDRYKITTPANPLTTPFFIV